MGLEVCCVDHHGRFLAVFRRQPGHHPREDALFAPTLPPAVERLMWAIRGGRIAPTQAIAIDENNPAQHPSVINPGLPVRPGKEGSQARHLRVGQPEEIAHVTAPFSEA